MESRTNTEFQRQRAVLEHDLDKIISERLLFFTEVTGLKVKYSLQLEYKMSPDELFDLPTKTYQALPRDDHSFTPKIRIPQKSKTEGVVE